MNDIRLANLREISPTLNLPKNSPKVLNNSKILMALFYQVIEYSL